MGWPYLGRHARDNREISFPPACRPALDARIRQPRAMMAEEQRQRSRRGSENRQRQALIAARVDPEERRQIREAANRAGMPLATFIRKVVLEAAAS